MSHFTKRIILWCGETQNDLHLDFDLDHDLEFYLYGNRPTGA